MWLRLDMLFEKFGEKLLLAMDLQLGMALQLLAVMLDLLLEVDLQLLALMIALAVEDMRPLAAHILYFHLHSQHRQHFVSCIFVGCC